MKIFLSLRANRQLQKLPKSMHDVLIRRIEELGKHLFPQGVKKLTNRPGWHVRFGDYRILYALDEKGGELTILSVAHRKEAYRLS